MKILSLDLGTHMGWAYAQNGFILDSGTVHFKTNDKFTGGGLRGLKMQNWLNSLVQAGKKLELVTFEEVRAHTGVDAAHAYGGYLMVLTAWCELNGVPYISVPVGTIKKHATGKGNAKKEQMIDAAYLICGKIPHDDNEADAICIMNYTLKILVDKLK
jgi:Holliday junction resolvasome RuvABC endonuclease subunit